VGFSLATREVLRYLSFGVDTTGGELTAICDKRGHAVGLTF
jgi:hypothetical protein